MNDQIAACLVQAITGLTRTIAGGLFVAADSADDETARAALRDEMKARIDEALHLEAIAHTQILS